MEPNRVFISLLIASWKVAEASVKIFLRHERNPCQTIIKQNKVIHIYNNMHSLLKKRILSVCLFSSCMLQKYKNGHLYRLFSSDICNSSPKKTYRKPTENLQEVRKWHSIYLFNSELWNMWHKPIDIRIIYPYIYLKTKVMKKKFQQ